MSDADDEPFDKEAEKEKLRQQLAEEEADRQSTQHMSDLLLKGATMTNRHCDACGDPLFRHQGREFCPTCGRQRPVDGAEGAGEGGAVASSTAAEEGAVGPAQGDDEVATSGGQAADQPGAQQPEADQPAAGVAGAQQPEAGQPAAGVAGAQQPEAGQPAAGGAGASGPDVGSADTSPSIPAPTGEADLPAARQALARKVTALAREAEATTDVGRARELLAAVREGAEALRALEGAGR